MAFNAGPLGGCRLRPACEELLKMKLWFAMLWRFQPAMFYLFFEPELRLLLSAVEWDHL